MVATHGFLGKVVAGHRVGARLGAAANVSVPAKTTLSLLLLYVSELAKRRMVSVDSPEGIVTNVPAGELRLLSAV
jgi:hypothetical protein